jgi:cell division transport system permease protein
VIRGLQYFVTEAFLSLWRGRRSSALSILTISIALFMLGLFLLLSANLQRVVDEWSRSAEFSVYLRDEVAAPERDAVRRALAEHPAIAGIEAVSKEAALERFRRNFPELAPATAGAPDNPFPASFEARLTSPAADAAAVGKLAERIGAMPGVADVRYDRRWLDRLASISGFVRYAGFILAGVLVLAAGLTVANVVRLALYARRDEVEIMELVGAPMAFIKGPFVCEGIIQGGIGAVLALAALRIVLELATSRLAAAAGGMFDVRAITFIPAASMALVVAGGMAVGCLGGLVAARRLR